MNICKTIVPVDGTHGKSPSVKTLLKARSRIEILFELSQDPYGGNGYSFVNHHFLPRLQRHRMNESDLQTLNVTNPRRAINATI